MSLEADLRRLLDHDLSVIDVSKTLEGVTLTIQLPDKGPIRWIVIGNEAVPHSPAQKCHNCNGTGSVSTGEVPPSCEPSWIECPVCHGTGIEPK